MTIRWIGLIFCLTLCYVWKTYGIEVGEGCKSRDYGHGSIVCVCDSSYCDDLIPIRPPEIGKIQVTTSSKAGSRWNVTEQEFQDHKKEVALIAATFEIDQDEISPYQKIIGFGGAFTDAAGMNIMSVPEPLQNMILRAYFTSEGLEYSLGRVPIGGTDFSTHPYTYDDLELGGTDPELFKFTLAPEDLSYKIPLIQRAMKISPIPLKLFASAWSAPGWMKDSEKIMGKGKLLSQFYSTWADYHVKFIKRYAEQKITFWGLTAQNEPSDGLVKDFAFNSLGWTSTEQAHWIGEYLGPALHNSSLEAIKVMVLDDNRFLLPKWIDDVMSDSKANKYVSGVAIHWYLDWVTPPRVLDLTHDRYPHLFLLYTEACTGQWPWQPLKVVLGSWVRAENYAADIIENLQHWVSGWMDWNLALDMKGGPNWVKNYVDSPIIVNAQYGEFYKQPMYYALAHFTKALPEGSQRIDVKSTLNEKETVTGLSFVLFMRPDNALTLILLNKSHNSIKILVKDKKMGVLDILLEPHSLTTLVWHFHQ